MKNVSDFKTWKKFWYSNSYPEWKTTDIKYFSDLIESFGYTYLSFNVDSLRISFDFEKNGVIYTFEFNNDRDTASYSHELSWENGKKVDGVWVKDHTGFAWQNKAWTMDAGPSDVYKCLKRRLTKLSKQS